MQASNNNSNRRDLRAFIGATGSGKGVSIRATLRELKPRRLLVWDPLGEYGEFVTATVGSLEAVATMAKGGAFQVAYWPGEDESKYRERFALFCRIAFAAGDLVMLIEELSEVTSPSYAPPSWRKCTKQGRHRGLIIMAGTQRPADIDKHFFGATTYIRCFMLGFKKDSEVMADCMRVTVDEVKALETIEEGKTTTINYIEREKRLNKTTFGTIKLKRK